MTNKEIAQNYIEYLEAGDISSIINLFTPAALVHSPIYGTMPAADFYNTLATDTTQSELRVDGIFEEADSGRVALYFHYKWTLKNGEQVDFEVVDIIYINENGKIEELRIIYDTLRTRALIDEMKTTL